MSLFHLQNTINIHYMNKLEMVQPKILLAVLCKWPTWSTMPFNTNHSHVKDPDVGRRPHKEHL